MESPIPPLTITGDMVFKDVNGKTFKLYLNTAKHIVYEHRIYHLENFVRETLLKPCTIIESKHSSDCQLYYAQKMPEKSYYRVVVVDAVINIIKTAYICTKVKGGKIIW